LLKNKALLFAKWPKAQGTHSTEKSNDFLKGQRNPISGLIMEEEFYHSFAEKKLSEQEVLRI
jgi:hypothetical protein